MKRAFLAEVIATALLVGIGLGAVHVAILTQSLDLPAVAGCWGGAVILLIAVAGPVSGAHANPAVTIALACMRRFPWSKVGPYILAQFIGALAVAGLLHRRHLNTGTSIPSALSRRDTGHHDHLVCSLRHQGRDAPGP